MKHTFRLFSSAYKLSFSVHVRICVLAFVFLGFLSGCNGSGNTSTPSTPTAPSNLVYSQTTITASFGQAITPDTPSVTGAVSSYGISPSLPAGLSLNTSTGAISGTPTAAVAQATYTVTATNAGGTTTATLQITVTPAAPSNLVYPQTTIAGTIGLTITPDTPSVTGTVSSYSVSPTLPAGLSLNTSTGTISGTPTAAVAQATYTVTATNAGGATTATLQIAVVVNVAAPSNLVYPQTPVSASIGLSITPDIPSVTGAVSSYSVSPTLPAGLSLNTSTGTISGTPTAAVAQATYTVTATNAGGTITANVSITVLPAQNVLLELGHSSPFQALRFVGDRVLSADSSGHWVLWDYTSGAILVSGDGVPQPNASTGNAVVKPIDIAGQTVVIGIANGLEVRSLSDGHLISLIVYPGLDQVAGTHNPWWQLASDGSYICIGSQAGLFVFTPTGQAAASKPGDYSLAKSFAAPGKVLVALGPAGQNVLETVSTADGTSSVSPAFSGQFNSWFVDGGRFLTNEANTVWVYSDAAVQQSLMTLPTVATLTGQGNWIWTYDYTGALGYALNVYPVGTETPALTYNGSADTTVIASATTIGILPSGAGKVSVIDLSGSTPAEADHQVPVAYLDAYAAGSASQWLTGNTHGALLDGTNLSSAPRYFGYGAAWSIAGTSGTAAISTASGKILVFDPSSPTPKETINFSSGKLALSSDGSVLGAFANANDAQYELDRTLNFYSLPSGSVTSSFPYTYESTTPTLFDFSLAASGTTIGQVTGTLIKNASWSLTRKTTDTTGGTAIWSDTITSNPLYIDSILLSPDGTLIGESAGAPATTSATNIIKNGTLTTAVSGFGVGWIDNDRILVNQYKTTVDGSSTVYSGCTIYNSTGVQLATPALPELKNLQPVTADSVYDPTYNAIYSLTTGQQTWTGTFPNSNVGGIAGAYVVYESGHSVLLETF